MTLLWWFFFVQNSMKYNYFPKVNAAQFIYLFLSYEATCNILCFGNQLYVGSI
ncbi:hypothetical protein AP058_03259 [Flavobacterium sp. TAB 87]|nr:hypothetical protein AP058_03259 [Flavobacterium sp. TAB 87]